MEIRKAKPTLSVSLDPHLLKRLKTEIKPREVSQFVERAIAKELGENEEKITTEQKNFQQKLVRGYQAIAKNPKLKEELAIWEEVLENGRNK